ncbi:bifunctional helix-turn-helix domain-containing protein/methylated-DNA--[protein]-cysteine S-methyltransferase [Aliiroseovarius sp.]|uniref:bifunctional helix-turn-helix domain-containing protein/methylated-DNA--[protein]-cysteine S-methyltransferase n=1 Tax=Aliiroseovarius sp. TaxID=1872442 RepID=UPI0026194913|nr:bifunctional helix-turn-helix domain-containing protein/methylated-DNA--[protein]-cysteine S-methyltransferase [Aliiroseovarius sp.]
MDGSEQQYHYQVIRRAIDEIDRAAGAQLSLDDLARRMNMSPAHFQRVFSRWVGVSPKRYQQYLALGHAKTLLREHFTTLDTAHAVGLSGSGRLHDLFLTWEAMSPGDYARRGDGVRIRWGWFESPFGPAIVMATARGICGLGFAGETGAEAAMGDMLARWPRAEFVEDPLALRPMVDAVFEQNGKAALHLMGAPFQVKVWEALLTIPSGHVTTYSEIAQAVGNPKAVRAVGNAVGRNPVSFLIPCHRALRKSGGLGGYHWGQPVKRAILAWEAARLDNKDTAGAA